ncbi:MAG: response regulator [Candidatus Eremiobacterota bacterium]
MRKILIVDDKNIVRDLLTATLKDKNFEILSASTGYEAIEIARKEKPSLMFLDVMMPEMDGFEVCERLKSDDSTKDIYIIVLTSINREKEREIAFKAGADDYLTKPFRPLDILKKMEAFFSEI